MSAPTAAAALPAVPAAVQAFAEEQGVADYLPEVLAMTRRIFPTAPLTVFVEDDHGLQGYRYIVVRVDAASLSGQEGVEEQWRWCGEIQPHHDAQHRPLFVLGVE
jgi:hypothetical protein